MLTALSSHLRNLRRQRGWRIDIERWRAEGSPLPPPHAVKSQAVWHYGRGIRTLIETGTHHGAMLDAVRHGFDRVVSIELDPYLFRAAANRFAGDRSVTILAGNSAQLLAPVVADLQGPALFWLDAHYSGEGTAFSENPIMRELQIVLHSSPDHIVLADDAVDLNVAELEAAVKEVRPTYDFEVQDNIVRIHPPGLSI